MAEGVRAVRSGWVTSSDFRTGFCSDLFTSGDHLAGELLAWSGRGLDSRRDIPGAGPWILILGMSGGAIRKGGIMADTAKIQGSSVQLGQDFPSLLCYGAAWVDWSRIPLAAIRIVRLLSASSWPSWSAKAGRIEVRLL